VTVNKDAKQHETLQPAIWSPKLGSTSNSRSMIEYQRLTKCYRPRRASGKCS